MDFWQYALLFLAVILGGGIAFYIRQFSIQKLRLFLSFSGAYILGITVLHLIPEVFGGALKLPGLWLLVGFFVQLLLEQLSVGVEHGHIHAQPSAPMRIAISIMIGLSLHAFLEGMPLAHYPEYHGGHEHHHHHLGEADPSWHLLLGIILHKAPAAFSLTTLLLLSGFKRSLALACLILFSFMSPLGALLGDLIIRSHQMQEVFLGIVVGSFLHIATTILFEADNSAHHHISLVKLGAILAGLGLSLFTLML